MTDFYDIPIRSSIYGESGFIYMVAFDNAARTVKVGASAGPRSRVMEHRNMADCFDVGVHDVWVSPEHYSYNETEAALIHLAGTVCSRIARKEYFLGVDWATLRDLAKGIDFDLVPDHMQRRPNTYLEHDMKIAADRARWLGAVPA